MIEYGFYRSLGLRLLPGSIAIVTFLGLLMTGCLSGRAASKDIDYYMVVAKDGSGDYTSVQAALDNTKAFPDKRIVIFIKNGIYHEKVRVYSWNNKVTLKGEDREKTVISFDDYFDKIGKGRNSTFHTPTLLIEGDDFIAENLTIENTAGPVGQAVALAVVADRCVISNCILKGNQDTLYTAGEGARQYFDNCYIEGTTDFIFGEATAVFNNCTIHSKADSYITAASTPEDIKYGYVFIDCELAADKEVNRVYLGRPWRNYAKTVFINCEMGDFIHPKGWKEWNSDGGAFYAEYNSRGPGVNKEERVEWSHQLTDAAAANYTIENIFRGWNPRKAKNN